MSKSFKENLNPSNKTFVELKSEKYPWWDNLKKNKDISIQVRKDNTIDVYYNGGAILSSLKYDVKKKEFKACIHPKYIPLEDEAKYNSLSLTSSGVKFPKEIKVMDFSQFEDKKLQFIMKRIEKYYGTESEKAIQFNFIAKDPFIIDAEFQVPGENKRIDLVRLDKSVKKIVLIEVKTMADSRLFAESKAKSASKDAEENIYDQLKKYHEFAVDYKKCIHDYYVKVLQVKKDLGLARPELEKISIDDWQVEHKPLLVFGDCKQLWIDINHKSINEKIKGVAYGAYYFGKPEYSLKLLDKPKKNQYVFSASV